MLIVISGPIASGKSSVARGVAAALSRRNVASAIVELDEVYQLQAPAPGEPMADAARWRAARHAAAAMAESSTAKGIAAVIVEGSFQSPSDRLAFSEAIRSSADALFVALRVSYGEALRRAQADPTRGRSRDPAFLRAYYDDAAAKVGADTDLVIDTESNTEEEAVAAVVRAVLARLG